MIAILGATGRVGGAIADLLLKKGEAVRLVARNADRLRTRVGKKSQAWSGDANDVEFLVKAFKGVDTVFTLVPPNLKAVDLLAYQDKIGESIARAVEISRVERVVNLSSIGAELPSGTGPVVGLHHMEERLNRIDGLNVLHLRAAYFMENLLWSIDLIKTKGINGDSIRGDLLMPMIATKDIAAFAAERLVKKDFTGSSVRYLLGQRDISFIEATGIIGSRIGKPGLPYIMFPYDEAKKAMIEMGLSHDISSRFVEMARAFNESRIVYERSRDNTTPTSIESFCDEVFVPVYSQKKAA